jgi:hypothetical protein
MVSRKAPRFVKTIRTVFVLLPLGFSLVALLYFFGPPGLATHHQSSTRQDGEFKLDVYSNVSETFLPPGQSSSGSNAVLIVLRNSFGARIGSSWGCDLKMSDVKVEWNWAEHKREVQIAANKTISLDTGDCLSASK